jgi:hypothetical protein
MSSASNTIPAPSSAKPAADLYAPGLSVPRFLLISIGSTLAAAAMIALVVAMLGRADIWRGYVAGVTAGIISAVVSSVPVCLLFSRTVHTIMTGFLAAGGLRAVALGAIVVMAVRVGGYPQVPTVAIAGLMYVVIVAAEGFTLWSMIEQSLKRVSESKSNPTT